MPKTFHEVTDGDDGPSIAARYGFKDFEKIWSDGANAGLRAKRPDCQILHPGDIVAIPERGAKTETLKEKQVTGFKLTVPKREFVVVLQDQNEKKRSGIAYKLVAGDKTFEGKTGDNGEIRHFIGVQLKFASLFLGDKIERVLSLGFVNPMKDTPDDGVSGVAQRLAALGYDPGPDDGADDAMLASAIYAFQRDHELELDGEIGPKLIEKLEERFGR